MLSCKLVILGEGGVGKSSLTVQFTANRFIEAYDPTIEDSYSKLMVVDDTKIRAELLDTAGTEQFMALHSLYIKSGDAFVLCFSLTSMDSLTALTDVRTQILRIKEAEGVKERDVAIVLVGTKCDLVNDRTVDRQVAIDLSSLWGGVPYYETSARKRVNVDAVFEDAIRQILRRDKSPHSSSPTHSRISHRRKKREGGCTIL